MKILERHTNFRKSPLYDILKTVNYVNVSSNTQSWVYKIRLLKKTDVKRINL